MEINDQCNAIGIPADGVLNGLPKLGSVFFERDSKGLLVPLLAGPLKPWEKPTKVKGFDQVVLAKIQSLADGKVDDLEDSEKAAITAKELVSEEVADFTPEERKALREKL